MVVGKVTKEKRSAIAEAGTRARREKQGHNLPDVSDCVHGLASANLRGAFAYSRSGGSLV